MADPQITIRDAEIADLPAVRALLVETWHDTYDTLIGPAKVSEITNSWHSIENLKRQLGMADTSFLVAEVERAIVGHAFANGQRPPVLLLSRLYVLPSQQRRGIGERLVSEAIARHPECGVIRLEVETDNGKGLAFYCKQGFSAVAQKTVEGIGHVVMEKRLAPPSWPG